MASDLETAGGSSTVLEAVGPPGDDTVSTRAEGRSWTAHVAVALGILAAAVGLGLVPFVFDHPMSWQAVLSVLLLAGGVVAAVAGTVRATRGRRLPWRVAAGVCTLIATVAVVAVVSEAVAATNVPPIELGATPADRGLEHREVTVTTADGVRLAGWYLPARNRAAVVLRHGAGSTRSSVLAHAEVLADAGFGVLVLDARGHGESEGRAMDFGWHGDAEIAAATDFLASRPEVDEDRIGAVGMSMGGEEAIGAAASNPRLRALVAEGATRRMAEDEAWLREEYGIRGRVQQVIERVQDRVTALLTDAEVPVALREAVDRSAADFLLIAAGRVTDEVHAAEHIASAAPDRVRTWTVDDAGHTRGLAEDRDEWTRRVTAFLAEHLGVEVLQG